MKSNAAYISGTIAGLLFNMPLVSAQGTNNDVYWHIDPGVESCSMVIDPSLTQGQWKRFTREAGEMVTFKSLAPAEIIRKRNFSLSLEYSVSPVDQHDSAWINTFTHPDADCPLGDQIKMPVLRAKYSITDHAEVGIQWTTAPDANYGLVGAEVKYAILKEEKYITALSARASFVSLTGVKDFDVNIGSLDVMAGKKFSRFSPYIGIRESLLMGTETTEKVDLQNENLFVTQGFIGLGFEIWYVNLAAEYTISDIQTFSFLLGFRTYKSGPGKMAE